MHGGTGDNQIDGIRALIDDMEKAGELKRIKDKVHWKYELAEITRRDLMCRENRPALLFENIQGYEKFRYFTNGLDSHRKIAVALGLDPATPFQRVVESFSQRILDPLQPVLTSESPHRKNACTGRSVNLEKLPVPWFSRHDGGRYIGTWHLNVTRDPETLCTNVGIYRMQLLGPTRTAISISPGSHLALHLEIARQRGTSLEMAVAIGVDERLIMAAAAALPYGVNEYYSAGGLSGNPIVLSRCTTVDLEVPAHAEIVLEGKIDPHVRVLEGPFLDYTGSPKGDPRGFVFEVSCMMHRDNPIFRGATIGIPGGEDHLLFSLLSAAGSLDFHGSRTRQKIQNLLIRNGCYKLFQCMGKLRDQARALNPLTRKGTAPIPLSSTVSLYRPDENSFVVSSADAVRERVAAAEERGSYLDHETFWKDI